jgi:peptidoglycan hydrolase-like protein with peptidoglycan-binding domain
MKRFLINSKKNLKVIFLFLFFLFVFSTFFTLPTNQVQAEATFTFNQNLKFGIISPEVKELQKFLNANGYLLALTGPGSLGNETNKFGPLTKKAILKFQKANGLVSDGIVGPFTRQVVNKKVIELAIAKNALIYRPQIIRSGFVNRQTDTKISTSAIAGVTVPVTGEIPTATISDTTEYTATISWNGNPETFTASTVYTAIITITPKTGYTLNGISENFFTVTGGTATNSLDSGVVTVVFPETIPIIDITSNLVALWQNGSLIDATGRGNDLTAVDDVPVVSSGLSGIPNAFGFDGVNYAMRESTVDLQIGGADYTFSIWAKHGTNGGWLFNKDGEWAGILVGNIFTCLGITLKTDIDYQFHHYTFVYHYGSDLYDFYYDGNLVDSSLVDNITNYDNLFYLGGMGKEVSDNSIAQLAIYKRALTQSEITYLYNEGNGRLINP